MQEKNPKGKPFFDGMEMRIKAGKWFVIRNGEWCDFAGSEKDIEWRAGSGNKNDPVKVYGYKVSKKSLHDDLQGLNPFEYVVLLALRLFGDKEGHCWPTMRQLGELSGLDKATIQRNIKALSKKRFIKIEIKKGRGGKRFEYQLLK